MHDAHVHLDFMTNGEQVAADALAARTPLFATTVTPAGFEAARERFEGFPNVHVGWGMHPWWVAPADDRAAGAISPAALVEACDRIRAARFVGEVGLDFSKRHEASRENQLEAFTAIVGTCAEQGGKVLSIHSVRAARETLDVLERHGALDACTCIFHWYSGPSDQLKRAIDAGCYFSVGPFMVKTGKGREYVKAIPVKRLLLETDAPPGQGIAYSYSQLADELASVADAIASIKGKGALDTIEDTFQGIFG